MVLKKQQTVTCAVLIPAQYTNQRTKKTQAKCWAGTIARILGIDLKARSGQTVWSNRAWHCTSGISGQ
jgi:hypothetical protein